MKKLMMLAAVAVSVSMIAGCMTRTLAQTKTTKPDGTVTESLVSVIGTGDKASEVASKGLFADGTPETLGAGVADAKASQQSTGIKETLEGMGVLLTGIGQLVAKSQGIPVTPAVSVAPAASSAPAGARCTVQDDSVEYIPATEAYSDDGYGGVPGEGGVGVYGRVSCSRCREYRAAHPDVKIIDIGVTANRAAMWEALKADKPGFKFDGASVSLPVVITADGYTQAAK